jgi:hypothetical protein
VRRIQQLMRRDGHPAPRGPNGEISTPADAAVLKLILGHGAEIMCLRVKLFFNFFEVVWFGELTIRAGVSSYGKRQLEAKEAVISEMCNGAGAGGADDDLNACENRPKPHSKILYSFAG